MRPFWSSKPFSSRCPRGPKASLPDPFPRPSSPRPSEPGSSRSATGSERKIIKLAQAGKLDEAVAAVVKELAVTREVQGELHEDVVGSLAFLARIHEAREDWAAARKALTEVLAIRERQPDQKEWRIADARRALADLDRRAALDPAQRHGSRRRID